MESEKYLKQIEAIEQMAKEESIQLLNILGADIQ
jgi:hypothetical protein